MSWPIHLTTTSPEETKAVAAAVAPLCTSGDVVLLIGDLGAGKTAFAQGFAAALGVVGPVTSPTFALVRQYDCGPASPLSTLFHADVYRTESLGEVADLALAELVEDRGVALVEWGELAAPALGASALEITLVVPEGAGSPDRRHLTLAGRGSWADRADEVAAALRAVVGPVPA
jgi:tRNA threonylcarbamoyladenosine biosynthesis protein TsaE